MNNKQRTPLFHISKRAVLPWYGAWLIRVEEIADRAELLEADAYIAFLDEVK